MIAGKDTEIEELDKSIKKDKEILIDEYVTSVELRERVHPNWSVELHPNWSVELHPNWSISCPHYVHVLNL